jgi:hypothetical protein
VKDLAHRLVLTYVVLQNLKEGTHVRTVFQNVWGEYKYHSNPYIQGTTVPCDI